MGWTKVQTQAPRGDVLVGEFLIAGIRPMRSGQLTAVCASLQRTRVGGTSSKQSQWPNRSFCRGARGVPPDRQGHGTATLLPGRGGVPLDGQGHKTATLFPGRRGVPPDRQGYGTATLLPGRGSIPPDRQGHRTATLLPGRGGPLGPPPFASRALISQGSGRDQKALLMDITHFCYV